MISPALLATLTNLKNNRLLSGEAKSALAPFTGKTFTLPLAFVSASRTSGNPFDPVYGDGHTLIRRIESETSLPYSTSTTFTKEPPSDSC